MIQGHGQGRSWKAPEEIVHVKRIVGDRAEAERSKKGKVKILPEQKVRSCATTGFTK